MFAFLRALFRPANPVVIGSVAHIEHLARLLGWHSMLPQRINHDQNTFPIGIHFGLVSFTMKNVETNMMSPMERYKSALKTIQAKVDHQSYEPMIWEEPVGRQRTLLETKLLQELMDLHNTIERFTIPIFERISLVVDNSHQQGE